jgi:2-polyprenyl-3-methyl-5-hydroxy-6-metoxy-1,4-benzoquinol methylase
VKRIGILVVAYNAASTLARVLDRIPRDFAPRISDVLVADDASQDSTYLIGLGYQREVSDLPLTVIRHPKNLGYGGNQKAGYQWAIENDLDIVVLLHGDGQYAPEYLPHMVEALELDKCDAVFGSRMLDKGAALRGGMPKYKFVGNKILTTVQNAAVGLDLSEWHSGYRAYSVAALKDIPFEQNSDDFDFDTEIIIQLHEAGKRIHEIPIPTYYGDEICRVNGMAYALDVTRAALRYRAHKMGFGSGELAFSNDAYEAKTDVDSSHVQLIEWLSGYPARRVLDLGCNDGSLAAELRVHGHQVVGVDVAEHPGVRDRTDQFLQADLEQGIPTEAGTGFDVVLAADVLEHVSDPQRMLEQARSRLTPGGSVVTSVPNFGHWYPRFRVLLGQFDYDRRGILDRGHLRFFTRRSFERLAGRAGFRVRRRGALGLPFDVMARGGNETRAQQSPGVVSVVRAVDRFGVKLWPTLFAYQFLYVLEPEPE